MAASSCSPELVSLDILYRFYRKPGPLKHEEVHNLVFVVFLPGNTPILFDSLRNRSVVECVVFGLSFSFFLMPNSSIIKFPWAPEPLYFFHSRRPVFLIVIFFQFFY